jgi:pimeloyl-ACP methyl ester carboxylesterase
MAIYVLVTGGFGGSWIYREVKKALCAAGHEVFTPSLTGMGERVHLAHPDVDLSTFIQDVVNEITYANLYEVILAGFSFGGMVITGAAEKVPERISRLVYLDAYVPEDGQSAADLLSPELTAMIMQSVQAYGEGWKMYPVDPIDPRLTFQPIKTALEKIHLSSPQAAGLPRVFVYCPQGKTPENLLLAPITSAAQRVRHDPRWSYYEIDADHGVLMTHALAVSEILLEQAKVGA